MEEKKYHIEESEIVGDRYVSHRLLIVLWHHQLHQYHPYHGMRLTTPIPILWGARWSR